MITHGKAIAAAATMAVLLVGAPVLPAESTTDLPSAPEPRQTTDDTRANATQGTKGNLGPGSAESSGYFGGMDATTYGGSPEVQPPKPEERETTPPRQQFHADPRSRQPARHHFPDPQCPFPERVRTEVALGF